MFDANFKLFFLLCLAPYLKLSIAVNVAHISALDDFNCTVVNQAVDVELGWPYWASCSEYVDYVDEEQQCLIINGTNHNVLFNETSTYYDGFSGHRITDITADIVKLYVAVIREDKTCILRNLTFNHVTLSNSTCENGTPAVAVTRLPLDSQFTIDCEDAGASVQIHLDKDDHDFQAQWFYNCSTTLPEGVEEIKNPHTGLNQLFFPKVSLSHPGKYTCAITYKNTTRYFVQHNTCVRLSENEIQPPTVKCTAPEILTDLVGNPNITLRCVATFGFGRIPLLAFTSEWIKEGSTDFTCHNFIANVTTHRNGYSCIFHIDNPYNDECIGDPNLAPQRNRTPATATLQLMLRNIGQSDLGRYHILIRTPGKVNATANIELKYDPNPVLSRNALIIGLCVGLITLVILIILGIICYHRCRGQ